MSKKKGHVPGPKGDMAQFNRMKEILERKRKESRDRDRVTNQPQRKREIKDGRKGSISAVRGC